VIAERLGKAIRTPARDALLSHASYEVGRGVGFGLHEALDQIGAVVSPLLLGLVLALQEGDYGFAFGILAVPGLMALAALVWARVRVPDPSKFEPDIVEGPQSTGGTREGMPAALRRYFLFAFVATIGFAPFPLISFHLTTERVVAEPQIPPVRARDGDRRGGSARGRSTI
jgi:MFS family permease